jgi:hypothetical protein
MDVGNDSFEVAFFADSAAASAMRVCESRSGTRYLYQVNGQTIDAAYPLYWRVSGDLLVWTNSAALDVSLARALKGLRPPCLPTTPNSLGAVTDLALSQNAVYALYAPTGTQGALAGAETTMLARIDRKTQAVVRAGPFPGALLIAVGSGGVWVAGNRLMLLDADSLKQLTEIALPAETAGSIQVVASTAGVWVAHGRHLYQVDSKTGRTLQTRTFSGIAVSIALSPNGGRIYVGADGDPFAWYSVATINAFDTSTLTQVASTQTDGAGLGGPRVAAANDGVWAAIATGMQGYVEHRRASDLSRLPVPPSDQRHSNGVRVYVAGGYVWATDGGTGRLDCLDPPTGSVLSSKEQPLGGVVAGDSTSIYIGGLTGVESLTPDPSCKKIS